MYAAIKIRIRFLIRISAHEYHRSRFNRHSHHCSVLRTLAPCARMQHFLRFFDHTAIVVAIIGCSGGGGGAPHNGVPRNVCCEQFWSSFFCHRPHCATRSATHMGASMPLKLRSYTEYRETSIRNRPIGVVRQWQPKVAQIFEHKKLTPYQSDTKSNPHPNPYPNPTIKQNAIVNIQLNVVIFPTYIRINSYDTC